MLGLRPTAAAGGWSNFQIAPQPGGLAFLNATAPTPLGEVSVGLAQQGTGVSLALGVPGGCRAAVCMPPVSGDGVGAGDRLEVEGGEVGSVRRGRMLCAVEDVGEGQHWVVRLRGGV